MKGMLGISGLLIATLAALPASAGTLYKCVGSDGVPSYVSKRISGASCSAVSSYRPTRSSPARPAPAVIPDVAAVATPAVEPTATTAIATAAPTPTARTPSPLAAGKPQRVVSGQVYSYMKDGVRHYTSARPVQVASLGEVRTIRYSFIEKLLRLW